MCAQRSCQKVGENKKVAFRKGRKEGGKEGGKGEEEEEGGEEEMSTTFTDGEHFQMLGYVQREAKNHVTGSPQFKIFKWFSSYYPSSFQVPSF